MTSPTRLRRLGPPLLSAVATAALLITVLAVQRVRGAWPFAVPTVGHSVATASRADEMTGMESEGVRDRVPIQVTSSTVQSLGIQLEDVRRESLTQAIQAVATIVPDESLISHVHTRVAGWVEQLDVNTTGELVTSG